MTKTHLTILDAPCGTGKTTAMIKGFTPEKKYLVVVPYLSEAERIIASSTDVPFQQPLDEGAHSTKSDSIEALLLEGANIVTTHSLYPSIVSMVRQGLLNDYQIIIDEVPDVCEQVRDKNPRSIDEFYLKNGYITVAEDGLVTATQKWDDLTDTQKRFLLSAETPDIEAIMGSAERADKEKRLKDLEQRGHNVVNQELFEAMGSEPNALTDDEYEMVFGTPRD